MPPELCAAGLPAPPLAAGAAERAGCISEAAVRGAYRGDRIGRAVVVEDCGKGWGAAARQMNDVCEDSTPPRRLAARARLPRPPPVASLWKRGLRTRTVLGAPRVQM